MSIVNRPCDGKFGQVAGSERQTLQLCQTLAPAVRLCVPGNGQVESTSLFPCQYDVVVPNPVPIPLKP
jgi:hypothetical protein